MQRTLRSTGPTALPLSGAARCSSTRGGFTLVELLVVIAIIGVLAGLSFAVLGTTGDRAKITSTKTTLAFLAEALQQRQQAFAKDLTEQERTRKRDNSWGNILQNALGLPAPLSTLDLDTRMTLVKQDRYRAAFPQRIADMYGLDQTAETSFDSPLLVRFRNYVRKEKNNSLLSVADVIALFPTPPSTADSSEILYFLLTEGADGVSGDLLNNVPPKHIGDTDNDGLPEFLDDWGHPLRFYNAPTALYASASASSNTAVATVLLPGFQTAGSADPYDPKGLITAAVDGAISFTANYHHPRLNFTPIIVSSGPDEDLGLYEPGFAGPNRLAGVLSADAAMDNISSIQPTGGQ